jgi:septal ring factor EnvC (AmiA/AmiB activator)
MFSMGKMCAIAAAWLLALQGAAAGAASSPPAEQLETVRANITTLERRLGELAVASQDAARERERLDAELELARARVRFNELTLEASQSEIARVRGEVARLASELSERLQVLRQHLTMVALLGQPGPLQMIFDVARGGELDRAVGTVAVLTSAQVRLLEEFGALRADHGARLAALSQILEQAEVEARELEARRRELEGTSARVEARLRELQSSQRVADVQLAELKGREQALRNLMTVLGSRDRFTGSEDVRRYRGALPWPANGPVLTSFGRHYLPKYATYTVCNGVRLELDSGAPVRSVFPGVVAFAGHFRGYGNMVVLDHGHAVYSLAAGLATIHVRLNQSVTMGSQLGLAAPAKSDGNLYFEIRVGGEPEDPRRWLQLEEAGS